MVASLVAALLACFPYQFASAQQDPPSASPTPVPEETVPTGPDNLIDRPDYKPGHPYYLQIPSRWAFGLRFAVNDLPVSGALGSTFQFYVERMFEVQSWADLAGGLHIGSFPLFPPATATARSNIPWPDYANSILGAQLKLQLKYARDALLVPVFGVEWEFYQIKESYFNDNIMQGSDLGLSAGIMLNLGFIDRATEYEAYQSIRMTRAYLSMEIRTANINTPLFRVSGNYWLWGLRLELE